MGRKRTLQPFRLAFLLAGSVERRYLLLEGLRHRVLLSTVAVQAHEREEPVRLSVFRFAVGEAGKPSKASPDRRAGVSIIPLGQCLAAKVHARVTDGKVTRLIAQFLKAGVLADGFLLPTDKGTPQGGVISPLLANIALAIIEERYERWTHHRRKIQARRKSDATTAALWARMTDRKAGRAVFFPIRYADDFVVLVSGTREQAEHEKAELASYLQETMKLELSIEKTRVSDLTEGFQFLSQRVRYKWHPRFGYMPRIEIPTSKRADLRYMVRQMTSGANTLWSLTELLQKLNPVLRGWGNYYRFCTGASRQFAALDFYAGDCIWRWLMKKHKKLHRKRTRLMRLPSLVRPARKLWREGNVEQFLLSMLRVERFRRGWMRTPAYICVPGEPDA